jgi:methylenetetrahydrofolate reductase (NADPH)
LKTFRKAVQGEGLALTAELTLKREFGAGEVLEQARTLTPYVDAVQVSDNPYGWAQMSATAAAGILVPSGIDAIPILTCRDRNRIALHGELLGMKALGVSSLILTRGHRVPEKHEISAATVFDTTGRELIAIADRVGRGDSPGADQAFFIGTGARAFRPKRGWRAEALRERAALGAQFLQTQLCLNIDIIRRYLFMLVETRVTWDYSVVVSLAPLPSAKTAHWIKRNMSDSMVPRPLIERLEKAQDPRQEGIDICVELMREIAEIPGVSGINLLTMGDPDAIAAALRASGLAAGRNSAES